MNAKRFVIVMFLLAFLSVTVLIATLKSKEKSSTTTSTTTSLEVSSNLMFDASEIEAMYGLDHVLRVSWSYNVPVPMWIVVYVGDSLQSQEIFMGKIQGNADICQMTNLKAEKRKNLFVSIYDRIEKKLLLRQKLVSKIIGVGGVPTSYELFQKEK